MKWSSFVHAVAKVAAIAGVLALLGAWLAGAEGTVLGFNQVHLFEDAKSLFLLSIASGVGTLIHLRLEK